MSDVLLSETCVCGGDHWHQMVSGVIWCRRCGCLKITPTQYWRVPLDRAGELSSTAVIVERDDPPTSPGTPEAKKISHTSIRVPLPDKKR